MHTHACTRTSPWTMVPCAPLCLGHCSRGIFLTYLGHFAFVGCRGRAWFISPPPPPPPPSSAGKAKGKLPSPSVPGAAGRGLHPDSQTSPHFGPAASPLAAISHCLYFPLSPFLVPSGSPCLCLRSYSSHARYAGARPAASCYTLRPALLPLFPCFAAAGSSKGMGEAWGSLPSPSHLSRQTQASRDPRFPPREVTRAIPSSPSISGCMRLDPGLDPGEMLQPGAVWLLQLWPLNHKPLHPSHESPALYPKGLVPASSGDGGSAMN